MSFINLSSITDRKQIKIVERDAYILEIWEITLNNEYYKLKFWRMLNSSNTDLVKEIWLNEVRQLNKLRSVTSADKYLELLYDNFIDDEGNFCLLYLDNGETANLLDLKNSIEESNRRISIGRKKEKNHWLHLNEIQTVNSRIYLWKNILRLIEGIQILHSQGIIHRKINLENVLYDNAIEHSDTERFKLSGFEQSLNISSIDSSDLSFINDKDNTVFSLYIDWKMLGVLILKLLDIELNNINDSFLSHKEVNAIGLLLERKQSDVNYIVDIEKVKIIIADIINELPEFKNDGISDPSFYLTTVSNTDSDMFQRLRKLVAKYRNIKNLTNDEFLKFLQDDLNISSCIIRQPRNNKNKIYMIKGKDLIYQITNYQSSEDWRFTFIVNIFETYPNWMDSSESYEFRGKLNFLTHNKIRDSNYTSDSTSWSLIIAQFDEDQIFSDAEIECLQGLLLCHAIEVSLMFTERYMVHVNKLNDNFIRKNSDKILDDGTEYISIAYSREENKENDSLSKALMIANPIDRLYRYFDRDLLDRERNWILSPVDDDDREVYITFESIVDKEMVFSIKSNIQLINSINIHNYSSKFAFYPESHSTGSETLIKRRTNSFYKLLEQKNLVSSLVDPSRYNRVTRLKPDIDHSLADLDESKAEVFKQLITTKPNFFIEGPPGVGKTYLITTFINQIFNDEPSSKVLLSAQSHETVKILAEAVKKKYDSKELIVINAFKEGINDPPIVQKVSQPYVNDFINSSMYEDALKSGNTEITSELRKLTKEGSSHSLFDSILKSANIIFSTTNHRILEDMIKKSIYFDISIMEESAKVSGIELISPMLISSKRVLIGDYLQLPAFLEQVIERINRNYLNFDYELIMKQLLKIKFRKDVFRNIGLQHIIDKDSSIPDNEQRVQIVKSLNRYFSLFKSLSTDAYAIKERGSVSFGDIINIQHRMHPDISKIISTTVYQDRLLDNPDQAEHFLNFKPIEFRDSVISGLNKDKAVIWVDIPDKNSVKEMTDNFESNLTNYHEIQVVKEILSALKISDDNIKSAYTVQVLSPYKNQVKELNNSLRDISLANGIYFDKPLARTVDSFQGNEADIIVISLVRHNSFTPITKALGFLMDMRRMNVLLSRAKYKMVIVGCFKMFKYWSDSLQQSSFEGDSDENNEFLKRLVSYFEPDYEIMLKQNHTNKEFKSVNFVSSKDFLEASDEE